MVVVQFSTYVVSDSATPWTAAHQASLSFTFPRSLLTLTFIESMMPSILFPSPSAFNLSQDQGLFQGVSSLHQVAKVLGFRFNISSSNEHPGLIFGMDWLDLLVAQGTLRSLLELYSSEASILQCSAFFTVQLLHPYMTKKHSFD